MWLDPQLSQIETTVANFLTPLRHFFIAVLPDSKPRRWDPPRARLSNGRTGHLPRAPRFEGPRVFTNL